MECPKCLKDKPLGSSHCPHCTHRVTFGEELEWNLIVRPLMTVFCIWVIYKFFAAFV